MFHVNTIYLFVSTYMESIQREFENGIIYVCDAINGDTSLVKHNFEMRQYMLHNH